MRLVFLLSVSLAVCACTAPRPVASQCALNSECASPLVCRFGACRVQCAAARDCPSGSLCVKTGGVSVCQLPAEQRCARASDCPSELVCSMSTCTNACAADGECASGQRCMGTACVECTVTSECGRDLVCERGRCVPPASGADAGSVEADSGPAPATRRSCVRQSDCRSGELCVSDGSGYACMLACSSDAECVVPERSTVRCNYRRQPDVAASPLTCGRPCELFGASGCLAGDVCSTNEVSEVTCRSVDAAPLGLGERCTMDSSCVAGAICNSEASDPAQRVCRQLCMITGQLGPPCPTGTTCQPLARNGMLPMYRGSAVGACATP